MKPALLILILAVILLALGLVLNGVHAIAAVLIAIAVGLFVLLICNEIAVKRPT